MVIEPLICSWSTLRRVIEDDTLDAVFQDQTDKHHVMLYWWLVWITLSLRVWMVCCDNRADYEADYDRSYA